MTLTILQLLNAEPVVAQLMQQKLKGVAALRIKRLAIKLGPELAAASAARDTLITSENSVAIDGGGKQIKPACVAAFLAAPLFAEVVEIEVAPLSPADIAEAQLSVQDLERLGPLFIDDGQ